MKREEETLLSGNIIMKKLTLSIVLGALAMMGLLGCGGTKTKIASRQVVVRTFFLDPRYFGKGTCIGPGEGNCFQLDPIYPNKNEEFLSTYDTNTGEYVPGFKSDTLDVPGYGQNLYNAYSTKYPDLVFITPDKYYAQLRHTHFLATETIQMAWVKPATNTGQ
jgi:hypothetical protein